jgi:amidohydrolase
LFEMKELSSKVSALAQEHFGVITEFRRDIHRHPEVGFQVKRTSQAIRCILDSVGIQVVPLKGEIGVLGLLEGEADANSGAVTALRADMDALPVNENTGLEYSSTFPQTMHACGHDGNVAAVAGAAIILAQLREYFRGTVKFIFQPAEETLRGAQYLIDQGVLENPPVERIFACHAWPWLPTGRIGVYPGNYMASAGRFEISLTSSGAHGAYPHTAPDAILAAGEMIQRLSCIVSREIDAMDHAVLSVCTMKGGQAFNVMPDEVTLSGTFRCLNNQVERSLKEAVARVVEGVAQTNRCGWNLAFEDLVPSLCNSVSGVDAVRRAAEEVLPPGAFTLLPRPCMGSEDFSLFLEKVHEGAFIRIGVTPEGQQPVPLHSNKFNYDDTALEGAMALLAQIVLDHHAG